MWHWWSGVPVLNRSSTQHFRGKNTHYHFEGAKDDVYRFVSSLHCLFFFVEFHTVDWKNILQHLGCIYVKPCKYCDKTTHFNWLYSRISEPSTGEPHKNIPWVYLGEDFLAPRLGRSPSFAWWRLQGCELDGFLKRDHSPGGGFKDLGQIPILTNIFPVGWNQQLVYLSFQR